MEFIWRTPRQVILSLAVLALLAASMLSAVPLLSAQEAKQEVRIALFQPRTAPVLNFYGTWAIQGFHLGLEYATGSKVPDNLGKLLAGEEAVYPLSDGRRIIVKVFDTQGKPDVAIARAREAIEEWGADILAGVTFSSVAVAMASIAREYEIPFFVFPAAAASITQDPVFNKYMFRIARNTEQDALAMIDYAVRTQGFKKFAFIAADYEFGWSYIESIQYALIRYPGTRIVDIEWVPLTTTDFRPYIERALAANPDALGIIWAGDFSLLYRDLAALGVLGRVPILGMMIDLYTTNFVNFCIPGLEGILENLTVVTYDAYVPDRPEEMYRILREMMIEENIYPYDFLKGHECEALDRLSSARVPDLWHAPAFATAQFIVDAIKAVPDLNVDKLIAHLEGRAMETPMGFTIIRPEDHQALRPFYVVRYVVDDNPDSETYGLLIGSYVETIPIEKVTPRLLTEYKPYPKRFSVSINAPSTIGVVPFEVMLSAVIEGGTAPYTCTWDLGDGFTAEGLSVTHTYGDPGVYTVKVECSDYIGLKATASLKVAAVSEQAFQTTTTAATPAETTETPTTTPTLPPTTPATTTETTAPARVPASAVAAIVVAAVIAASVVTYVIARKR